MITEDVLEEVKTKLRGEIIQPGHENYDEARKIYNGMIDKHPSHIIRCRDVADVIEAVKFGHSNGLDVAIRSGGHNGPGLSLVDDGMVIDLSLMKGIRVDPEGRTVRVEAGCTWGEVDHATHAFGLAAISGIISTTGVGGLTLGGGHGYLTRKHGLTIDNLLAADVVLADGTFVNASEDVNPDLYWALRGGGGNFGVVTSFVYKLHPVSTIIGGPMFWPIDKLETTLKWYRDWLPKLPEDVYAFFLTAAVPAVEPFPEAIHDQRVCGLMWCYSGPEEEFEKYIKQAREVAEPLFELTMKMPFPAIQSMFDGLYPPGHNWYWKGDFIRDIPDGAVAEHVRFAEVPTSHSTMHLYPIDGAVHRLGPNDTAWNKRDLTYSMVIVGVDPDPMNNGKITSWAKNYWEALHKFTEDGAYINFMMEEGDERIRATYGDNYERLQQVKAKYDPDNFFHVNQNIKPKA